jgi:hypothetical protein
MQFEKGSPVHSTLLSSPEPGEETIPQLEEFGPMLSMSGRSLPPEV